MPFPQNKVYGVLSATIQTDEGEKTSNKTGMSHFNLICSTSNDDSGLYQINIDIQSSPNPNVLMYQIDNFDVSNYFNGQFGSIQTGFTVLNTQPNGLAIDLIHQPLFDVSNLSNAGPYSADQISQTLSNYLTANTNIIVFGTKYDDSNNDFHKSYSDENDSYRDYHMYGVRRSREQSQPPRGVDDVHLNQGTPSSEYQCKDNGTYQDGALFIQRNDGSYTAFFFAFAEQCFNTDNNGNCC